MLIHQDDSTTISAGELTQLWEFRLTSFKNVYTVDYLTYRSPYDFRGTRFYLTTRNLFHTPWLSKDYWDSRQEIMSRLHEGFVIVPNLLDVNVEFRINERLHSTTRKISKYLTLCLLQMLLPIWIGNCYDGCGILEIQRCLHFQFAESTVSVADLEDGGQPRSRHLSSSTITLECS